MYVSTYALVPYEADFATIDGKVNAIDTERGRAIVLYYLLTV